MMKSLSINAQLVKALEQMPGYAKFMKDLVKKKRMNFETMKVTQQVTAIVHSMAPKLEDSGAFTILCTIGSAEFAKALYDLGANINLMPYLVFKTLGMGQPRPTSMRLQMADHTMKRALGVIDDVLVHVDKFILPVDFVILDCEVDYEVFIILGRPFLATRKALCDVQAGELTFWVGDEKVVFHLSKSMWQLIAMSVVINVGDMLEAVLLNFDDDEMDGFMEYVNSLKGMGTYTYDPHKLSLDHENRTTTPTKPSIEEPPTLELKPLPPHLWYEFLRPSSTLSVNLSSYLTNVQEIIKWLDVEVVYPIFECLWTSPVQCVPKKERMMVVTNEKNELIPTRTVTGWRVGMDYRKLNKVMRNDHFPLPFLDQILDRLVARAFYCFFDGYFGYNQILIAP
ncbi:uncharacterized protein [Nicotiana sylvestris]|uniref:uncharacterized protein n=1 Tax=Nicotiana sylvestris TaxID=4096 RepID=UPI00388CADDD